MALAVRMIVVGATAGVPSVRHLTGDAAGYMEWARRIAGGEFIGNEAFYQAPLYPYVLAGVLALTGGETGAVRIVQALWGAAGVLCLGVASARLFGRRTGALAALMLALYAPALFFDGIIQKASLASLMLCVLLLAMSRSHFGLAKRGVLCIGATAALLALTRENALVWLPILAAWIGITKHREGKGGVAGAVVAYGIGVALVLGVVGVRNLSVSGQWSVTTFQAGPNFYIGNHIGASGRYEPLVRGRETPTFERRDATQIAERALGRPLTPREVSRFWRSRAMADIRAEPGAWLALLGRKMLMVWNRYEVSDVDSQYVFADSSALLAWLGRFWHFGILAPLAASGVVATWHARRRLWVYYALILTMAGSVALFYVMARYRFPLAILLIPFAAAGCTAMWRMLRRRRFRQLLVPVATAGLVAVLVNIRVHDEARLNAMARMNVGVALAKEGRLPEATAYFVRAVEVHPGSAEAHNNLAQALALQDEYAEAIVHYRAALRIEPGLLGVEYNFAVALEHIGNAGEALAHYRQALQQNPNDQAASRAIARLTAPQ